MTKKKLAAALRKRLLDNGHNAAEDVAAATDDQTIRTYTICQGCGDVMADGVELAHIIDSATTAQHFIDLVAEHHAIADAREMVDGTEAWRSSRSVHPRNGGAR